MDAFAERCLPVKGKLNRKQLFFAEHPYCCFCGGGIKSTTVDHVPPKACFPVGHWPETFEFPACESCNHGTTMHDQIFGFYSMLLDFDRENISEAEIAKLRSGIENNYPGALPDTSAPLLHHMGVEVNKPRALLYTMTGGLGDKWQRRSALDEAATVVGRKLTCALYYRESKKALTTGHSIMTGCHQIQNSNTAALTEYFAQLLPDETIGLRSNIREYGKRFVYKWGIKEKEESFVYAAQFGMGLLVWGIATGPDVVLGEPLRSMAWRVRGFGDGS
jgi:hypothetical protein